MFNRRFHLHGLFAVLLALMVQLGAGAAVPRLDPVAGAAALCHTQDDAGGVPSKAPSHPADCPICPVCVVLHASTLALIPAGMVLKPPAPGIVVRTELPPPSTVPPTRHRLPSQPRAPPVFS